VYLYLSIKGLQKGHDLISGLNITKQQLYRSLKTLQSKGIVNATLERPARFSAQPLEKVLDLFLKARVEEIQRLRKDSFEILSDWHTVEIEEHSQAQPKFNIIEGRSSIYPKIQQMIQETHDHISAVASVTGLIQANQAGLFDKVQGHPLKSKIQFRFLTYLSQQNGSALKTLLSQMMNARINCEGRTPDSASTLFPRMVIRDEEEILFFITPRTDMSMVEQNDVCLWTNCRPLVQAFVGVFEEIWRHATNIQERIAEENRKNNM
jgi:hypothetical protein